MQIFYLEWDSIMELLFLYVYLIIYIYIYNLFITKYSYVHYVQLPCIFNSNISGPNIKVTKNSLEYRSEVGH